LVNAEKRSARNRKNHSLALGLGLEDGQPLGKAEFPLTEVEKFRVPMGRTSLPAFDTGEINFNLGFGLGFFGGNPAVHHFHVAMAGLAKNTFGIFERFHGKAPRTTRQAGKTEGNFAEAEKNIPSPT
jgi:hypothetical protein